MVIQLVMLVSMYTKTVMKDINGMGWHAPRFRLFALRGRSKPQEAVKFPLIAAWKTRKSKTTSALISPTWK
ncbi:hypothetical protein A3754_24740 [Alcanivorax sp. HI0083]|nr:hypothetical protein A3754_24740 [Alcanivorax sp. HI0083]